jgi:hypothetical protein
LLFTARSNSYTFRVLLFGTPNAAPSEPTLNEYAPRPQAVTVKPFPKRCFEKGRHQAEATSIYFTCEPNEG